MTDSPRRDGADPTQPLGDGYPGYTDPAYAGQAPARAHLPGPGGGESHRAAARVLAVRLRPLRDRPIRRPVSAGGVHQNRRRPMIRSRRAGCGSSPPSRCWPSSAWSSRW